MHPVSREYDFTTQCINLECSSGAGIMVTGPLPCFDWQDCHLEYHLKECIGPVV